MNYFQICMNLMSKCQISEMEVINVHFSQGVEPPLHSPFSPYYHSVVYDNPRSPTLQRNVYYAFHIH